MQHQIRRLKAHELDVFRKHLARLDASSRRDRFNGIVSDCFLDSYALKSLTKGTVFGAFEGDILIGAAELHPSTAAGEGEFAISIERPYQGIGLGFRLMQEVISFATSNEITKVVINMHPNNHPMRALVRRFGGSLEVLSGEVVGVIRTAQKQVKAA